MKAKLLFSIPIWTLGSVVIFQHIQRAKDYIDFSDLGKRPDHLSAGEYTKFINLKGNGNISLPPEQGNLEAFKEKVKQYEGTEITTGLDKTKVPYSITDKEIHALISPSYKPVNTLTENYWVEIERNNDAGTISIALLARNIQWSRLMQDYKTHTIQIKKTVISGFKTMNTKDILSERSVRVFLHQDGLSGRSDPSSNFVFTGSGFVLDKVIDQPIYYIATNKHVAGAVIPKVINGKATIGNSWVMNGSVVSPIDYAYNSSEAPYTPTNLNKVITFGDSKRYDHHRSSIFGSLQGKEPIKSIYMVNDFSSPRQVVSDENYKIPVRSFNKDHSKLSLTRFQGAQRSSIDMVIFEVEFQQGSDPFISWWKERPTKVGSLKTKNIFNFGDYWKNQNNWDVKKNMKWAHNMTRKDRRYSHFNMESGISIDNDIYTSGFPAMDTWCDRLTPKKLNHTKRGLTIKKGVAKPFSGQFYEPSSSDFSKFSYGGLISYKSEGSDASKYQDIQLDGASGSPIFDKNLSVIGILWGAKLSPSENRCSSSRAGAYNIFSYFSQKLEQDYFSPLYYADEPVTSYEHSVTRKENKRIIPTYDYLLDPNKHSFVASLNKRNPGRKTQLMTSNSVVFPGKKREPKIVLRQFQHTFFPWPKAGEISHFGPFFGSGSANHGGWEGFSDSFFQSFFSF